MTEDDEVGKGQKSRLNLVVAVLALVCSLIAPGLMLAGIQTHFGRISDLPEYYVAAKMIAEGKAAEVYKIAPFFAEQQSIFPSLGDRGIVLYIPPFSFLFLMPLALIAPTFVNAVWMFVLCTCVVLAHLVMTRAFKLPVEHWLWLGAAMAFAAPVYEALRIGQIAPLLLLAYCLALYFLHRRRDMAAGLCLSLLLLKPQELLPVVVFLLFSKRIAAVAAIAVIFGILAAVSWMLPQAQEMYAAYSALLEWSSTNTQFMQPELSATVRGQLLRLPGVSAATANMLSYGFLAAAMLAVAFAAWRSRSDPELNWLLLLLVAMPLGLISALHCHDYDLVLMIPSVVAFMRLRELGPLPALLLIMLLMPFMVPFYVELHFNYLLKTKDAINPVFVIFAAQVVILTAAGFKLLVARQKDPVSV